MFNIDIPKQAPRMFYWEDEVNSKSEIVEIQFHNPFMTLETVENSLTLNYTIDVMRYKRIDFIIDRSNRYLKKAVYVNVNQLDEFQKLYNVNL